MFRIISEGNNLPFSFPVDASATFRAGQVMMLTVSGNVVLATVSNGMAVFGIADDVKNKAFYGTAWDEIVIVPVPPSNITTNGSGQLITITDLKTEFQNPNIVPESFVSLDIPLQLIPRNGVANFVGGTILNFNVSGGPNPDSIKTRVRYQYQIPNVVGDDSTLGSGQITIWYSRMIADTDVFETNQQYVVNANLFVNETGMLTTRQIHPNAPAVATVVSPPGSLFPSLQFMWL